MMDLETCPFCEIVKKPDHKRILIENNHGYVMRDRFPITDGHTLIIPKKHVRSFFEINIEVRQSLLFLLDEAKANVDYAHRPDAFNIGINDGVAAGQTVPHLHIHLIPRYAEEVEDPRGGVRWLVPSKADYWTSK